MRILVFCPTHRIEIETISSIFNQNDVPYFDVVFTHDNPYPNEKEDWGKNIQLNYEKMRQIALSQGYKKIWIVESDMIPPSDALKQMLAVDAPIVTGLYAHRHGTPNPNVMRYGDFATPGSSMTWKEIHAVWGKTIETSGGCMGCLLIDVETIKEFSFITNERGAPDVLFMQHCWEKKYRQMAVLSVICGHKKPNGDILWPDRSTEGFRIESPFEKEMV